MPAIFPITTPHKIHKRAFPLPPDWSLRKGHIMEKVAAHPYACWLDSCGSEVDRYGKYAFLAGWGVNSQDVAVNWKNFDPANDWYLGALPYELKNQLEKGLHTGGEYLLEWPEIAFFRPQTVIYQKRGEEKIWVESDTEEGLDSFQLWCAKPLAQTTHLSLTQPKPDFQAYFTQDQYEQTIQKLREHIREGDFYEINLSQAYVADYQLTHPMQLFRRLIEISPVPFAGFLRLENRYALCASPERFLQHENGILRTQPIKGTAPRGKTPEEDVGYRDYLSHSKKEQAENVMIVDLSRNDLQRSCLPASVKVPYLFEIQAFPQVYQLVSTVEGQLNPELKTVDALSQAFPPGSMTGAPKVATLHHIEAYEPVARGLYAGSIGYFAPNGDMDLNVVIRSLMYDDERQKLSYHVGGAITYDSDPAKEYEETLIKARAIRRLWEEA